MNQTPLETTFDLMVIGTGMAGMAAALFAVNRGLTVVQAGAASELSFASGLLDLLAVHPPEKQTVSHTPWQTIDQLIVDNPEHPYAKMSPSLMREAFKEFTDFLHDAGLPYQSMDGQNVDVPTPVGTLKTTYCVPKSMWHGAEVLKNREPCLLIDFHGLKGFSAHQIKETLALPGQFKTVRLTFPGSASEIFTEHMAKALENPATRNKFAETIRPHIESFAYAGLPAVLGLHRSWEVIQDLENQLKIKLFEIPTMPPSVPGIRLKETFELRLPEKGVKAMHQQKVMKITHTDSNDFIIEVGQENDHRNVRAKRIILATGRFFGRGLSASRKKIKETLFNLPVAQPKQRNLWHYKDIFDPRGQPINRAGLTIDTTFRPLDDTGKPAFETLHAAGSILAHQDWMREKSGSGIAITTAFAAVQSVIKLMNTN